jgi:hypothetical protein
MGRSRYPTQGGPSPKYDDVVKVVLPLILIAVVTVCAFLYPQLTSTQAYVLVALLAIAVAVLGYWVGGKISVRLKGISAGGSFALFVIILLCRPQGPAAIGVDGSLAETTPEDMTLEAFISDFERANNVTVAWVDCSDKQRKAVVDAGTFNGKNIEQFLVNVQGRIKKPSVHYAVSVAQEGVRYEIHCK